MVWAFLIREQGSVNIPTLTTFEYREKARTFLLYSETIVIEDRVMRKTLIQK